MLVRDGQIAALLDAGSGAWRLLDDPKLLAGCSRLDVVLSHFHFDHVCGLPYLLWLGIEVAIWAPGQWLYGEPSHGLLASLMKPPISQVDVSTIWSVNELREGAQSIAGVEMVAAAQPRHSAPSAGLRVANELAYITDTPFEESSVKLARGVRHLLHEAWSVSTTPDAGERDATAADAARVALEADADQLTLIHLNPELDDLALLEEDAQRTFAAVSAGHDGLTLD